MTESVTSVDTAGGLTSVCTYEVATAKHMHCQVIYSTGGGGGGGGLHIQLHTPMLTGVVFLCWNML